jgi:hypothetical protein
LPGLRIAHPSQPIAERIGIGERRSVQEPHQPHFTSQRPEILEAAAPRLEQEDQPIDKDGGGLAPIAPRTRYVPIHEGAQPQAMVELRQQGQTPMGRQNLLRSFQL